MQTRVKRFSFSGFLARVWGKESTERIGIEWE